jgi:hypothetical protein
MLLTRRLILAAAAATSAVYAIPLLRQKAAVETLPAEPWAERLIVAARAQVGVTLAYDPSYTPIPYPGGDVPRVRGVCTDVIIRAYRDAQKIDLQKLVHEDMILAFSAYPRLWGLSHTDPNIDHRRVPNLQTFFKRRKADLPVTPNPSAYLPGDIVTQMLPGHHPHIVLVTDMIADDGATPLVVHNIGWGARLENVLFAFPITGHYRFLM